MKLKKTIIAGLLFGGATLAQADDRTFGDGTLPEFLKQFDLDGDGQIDEEERQAAIEARRAARQGRKAELDTDGDGRISREERKAALEDLRERIAAKRAEKFNAIAGEDGLMDLEEFSSIPGLSNAPGERVASLFARLDNNKDDFVDLEEFLNRLRNYRPDRPSPPEDPEEPEDPGLPDDENPDGA